MSKIVTNSFPITNVNGITINTSLLSSKDNYYSYSQRDIRYIVIHYTGNSSDTAKANANYFSEGSRGASAHYFVDNTSCYQSVALNNAAWAVGGTSYYKHSDCRNKNSISIEMCCSGNYQVSEVTEINSAYLCAELCKYIGISIDDVDKYVLRHWDVWAKDCPSGWTGSGNQRWINFKNRVKSLLLTADSYLDRLVNGGIIANKDIWLDTNGYVTKSQAVALIDKVTGGIWGSNEANSSIHWAQPHIISLCGKGIIENKEVWLDNPDIWISKAQVLAIVDKATNGILPQYKDRKTDHYGRNHLDSLCDKGIVQTPEAWANDFEATVNKGNFMALICKAFNI